MNLNKKLVVMPIIILTAAAVLLIGTSYLKSQKTDGDEQLQTSDNTATSPDPSADIPGIDTEQTKPSADIPNIDSAQSEPEQPYEAIDWGALPGTTLTDEEVTAEIKKTLDGLLRLDPAAIEHISRRSTGGRHNPLRVMFDAVLANKDMSAAFFNMAEASKYEIISVTRTSNALFSVTLSCTTPYMADVVTELAAGDRTYPFQEFTSFQASGAAKAVANMDMSDIPLNTDVVNLTFIVENDVPLLYNPISYNYGNDVPQYAFLWGAIDFQGVRDADLLISNHLGGGKKLKENGYLDNKALAQAAQYLMSTFDEIKEADLDEFAGLSLSGVSQGEQFGMKRTYADYQRLFRKYNFLENDTMNRLKSMQYSIAYYLITNPDTDSESYVFAVTYSALDPLTKERIYYTNYHRLAKSSRSTISENDSEFICMLADEIMEHMLGGSAVELEDRMLATGYNEQG